MRSRHLPFQYSYGLFSNSCVRAEKIADWTKAEEAKYQAELLRKELERQKVRVRLITKCMCSVLLSRSEEELSIRSCNVLVQELEAAAAAAAAEAAELEAKGKGGAKKGAKDDKAKKAAKGKASATPRTCIQYAMHRSASSLTLLLC